MNEVVEEAKTKKCSKCGEIKTVSQFTKDVSLKSGLSSQCKSCLKEKHKKRWELHSEEIKAKKIESRKNNPRTI
jgi:hypothetical protein